MDLFGLDFCLLVVQFLEYTVQHQQSYGNVSAEKDKDNGRYAFSVGNILLVYSTDKAKTEEIETEMGDRFRRTTKVDR